MKRVDKKKNSLRWIWHVQSSCKVYLLFLLIVHVAISINSVLWAWIIKGFIDSVAIMNFLKFRWYAFFIIIQMCFQLLFLAMKRFMTELSETAIENLFKQKLFSTLLYKEYKAVSKVHPEEWMNRLTSDTVIVAEGITTILPEIVGMITKMIGAIGLMYMYLSDAVIYIIILGILLFFLSYTFRKKLKRMHLQIQNADDNLRIFLAEHLSGLLVIHSFSIERKKIDEAINKLLIHKNRRMKRNCFSNICNIGLSAAIRGSYISVLIYCGWKILNGEITYGTFIAALQLIGQVQSPFASITGYLPQYYSMIASAERLMEAEEYKEDYIDELIEEKEINKFYVEEVAAIGFSHAVFSYEPFEQQREKSIILNNIDFEIYKGDIIALTGESGCGKSTLLKILLGVYSLDRGMCYIKKKTEEIIEINSEFRKLFSYVPQGNYLMSGSVREIVSFINIDEFRSKEDKERDIIESRVRKALEVACAQEFLEKLELNVDAIIGENGLGFSEGQLQRLAIARAVFSDRPILILDESTSALDILTERKLLNNLRLMTDKIVLIVTHRMEVLDICNKQFILSMSGDLFVQELHKDGEKK